MLVGYVSDENYSALADVLLEFELDGKSLAVARSSARGAVNADISPGNYRVTLAHPGFGSKTVQAKVSLGSPIQFRLLSDSLYGYAWPKWVTAGEKGEFRVHCAEPYHISLWRYGLKKEFVRSIGCFDEHGPRANVQTLPDGDFTQQGVGWNRRGYSRKFRIESDGAALVNAANGNPRGQCFCPSHQVQAPENSGLYYFHVETESGKFLSFPWVVAPRTPQAKIAVLASTNTWNAYNNFGGRSNYINSTRLPPTPTVNARQELSRYVGPESNVWQARDVEYAPLSFDRPEPFNHIPRETQVTDLIGGRQGCHLAPAEWRLLGWLERENFPYDFYSEFQLHAGQLELDAYEVLVISTHPEYWSRDMYQSVKAWVFQRGGKLVYLGGNGLDCEVEFLDESTLHFKTWLPNPSGALVFIHPDTGKKYECRLHHKIESPAQLLGVVFDERGISTAAPYQVVDSSHWVFAGTGLTKGDIFGTESLHQRVPGGASGHETDKRTASSPENSILLARGMNPDDGGAEIVLHETETGGAVFSVGSITWPACVLVDRAVSQITRNVLKKFIGKNHRKLISQPSARNKNGRRTPQK